MERTVPSTASEEVELYLRTYYSLLRSSAEVQIRTLEEAHAGMSSLMHLNAREEIPDMRAFIYSLLRLPDIMPHVQLVVMGQSLDVFTRGGLADVENWEPVSAAARRRKSFFNGKDTLACYIASRSDIDDLIPILTAFEIEWNKLHILLQRLPGSLKLSDIEPDISQEERLAELLLISWEDLQRMYAVWGDDFIDNLELMKAAPRRLRVQLLNGSLSEYRRATNIWWDNIQERSQELKSRPIYFVSSNTHSLANLATGFALSHQEELVDFLGESENSGLLREWNKIQAGRVPSSKENFLYYVLRKYESSEEGRDLADLHRMEEASSGILRTPSRHSFDVEAQVHELARFCPEKMDPRLAKGDLSFFSKSDALILNVDYPLGLAAYNILSKVSESVGKILGVYIIGKAASLNAAVGDVMISNVVHDEHSQNTYLFANSFTAADVAPYLRFGTVLDNQKAVSVLGTFLQTAHYMDVFYREGYTDIEMEAGPYLSAVYEMYRPKRHPENEIANLYNIPFDVGVIHYASDTPLSKGKNLGAGSLSYFGMDSTYAASIAVLKRIFALEKQRLV